MCASSSTRGEWGEFTIDALLLLPSSISKLNFTTNIFGKLQSVDCSTMRNFSSHTIPTIGNNIAVANIS